MDLHVAPAARDRIVRHRQEKGLSGPLRLSVHRTPCMGGRGHAYGLQFGAPHPDDQTVEAEGIRFVVDPESLSLLGKVEIVFDEGTLGGGLRVVNQLATGKCRCGHHDLFGTMETV